MSQHHDYNEVSKVYDDNWNAVGADIMAAMMQFHCGKPLKDLHVLDAGCGTGNYSKRFLDNGIGQITLLDASSGMMKLTENKLSEYIATGRIQDMITAPMPPLPFLDDTFDAVVFNAVIHHIENKVAVLKEAKRVTKQNGLIIISTGLNSTPKCWFTNILPRLTERFMKQFLTVDEFDDIFHTVGLDCIQKMNILGSDIMKDYYNFEGPLDENWRRAHSYWSHATEEEMNEIHTFIKNLKAKGQLEKWGKEHDSANTTGLLTVFMLAHKKNVDF